MLFVCFTVFNATYRVVTVCDSDWGYTYDRDVVTVGGFATPDHARLFVDVLSNQPDDDVCVSYDRLTVWDPCCDDDPTVVNDEPTVVDGGEPFPF